MREHKFRAWPGDHWIAKDSNGRMIYDWQDTTYIEYIGFNADGIIVMEWTGRKTKEGEEIYEDDWCRATFRTADKIITVQGPILMDEYMWCLDAGDEMYSINRLCNWEILGNIHENPDLPEKIKL